MKGVHVIGASSPAAAGARQRNEGGAIPAAGRSDHGVKPREPGSVKEAVGRAYAQAGGAKRAGVILQLGHSQTYAFADPDAPQHMTLAQAAALTSRRVTALAEYLSLLAGGVFLKLVERQDDAELHALTAESAHQFGEALSEMVGSLGDGKLTKEEAGRCVAQVDDAMRALAELRSRLQQRRDQDQLGEDDDRSGGTGVEP